MKEDRSLITQKKNHMSKDEPAETHFFLHYIIQLTNTQYIIDSASVCMLPNIHSLQASLWAAHNETTIAVAASYFLLLSSSLGKL